MIKWLKVALYWLSVIRPVLDALRGALEGVKLGHADAVAQEEERIARINREKFDQANR